MNQLLLAKIRNNPKLQTTGANNYGGQSSLNTIIRFIRVAVYKKSGSFYAEECPTRMVHSHLFIQSPGTRTF